MREAAEHYKVTERTIRRWIASGELKTVRPGGRTVRVIPKEEEGAV